MPTLTVIGTYVMVVLMAIGIIVVQADLFKMIIVTVKMKKKFQ